MGYFDGLTDASFKKDAAGNTVFYPWGIFSAGFVIDSEVEKNRIRNFYKKMYMIIIPAIILIQIIVGFWLNLLLLPIYIAWYFFTAKKITRELKKTEEKLKITEAYTNSAKSHNFLTLIFFELISLGFVAIGFLMLSTGAAFIAYVSIGFFGLCSIAIGYMIFAKIKNK